MLESVKEGTTCLSEGSDIGLGARCREFESPISDHSRQNLRLTIVIRRFCRLLSNYIKTRFIFGYNYILADASKQI